MFQLSGEDKLFLNSQIEAAETNAATAPGLYIRLKKDCGSNCSGKCGGSCQAACKSSCTSLFT